VVIKKEERLAADTSSKKYPDVAFTIDKAEGQKCVRCWNFSESVGKSTLHPSLCQKCCEAIADKDKVE
jgi:isoleucyl-tRNA synthetase